MTPTLNLVGAGHVGRVLGRLFAASGAFALQDVLTRSPVSAQAQLLAKYTAGATIKI